MQIDKFFKEYGAALGSALAFLLGIVALYIKYHFDKFSSKWNAQRSFKMLKTLIINSPPPPCFYPNKSEEGFIHADRARNGSNSSRFYGRLLAIGSVISTIEKDIVSYGELKDVGQFDVVQLIHT